MPKLTNPAFPLSNGLEKLSKKGSILNTFKTVETLQTVFKQIGSNFLNRHKEIKRKSK